MNLILKAANFAKKAHFGQKRKYTFIDFVYHPLRVMSKIMLLDNCEESWACVAALHDTLEDTKTDIKQLSDEFSPEIAKLVWELTSPSKKYPELNRAKRKEMDLKFLKERSLPARTIKLVDRIDNFRDTPDHIPFKEKYATESDDLLQTLRGTNETLEQELQELIVWFWENRKFEKGELEH